MKVPADVKVPADEPTDTPTPGVSLDPTPSAPPTSQPPVDEPQPGAAGLGDRLFPQLGNGGYDVQKYDLSLRYATSRPTQSVAGTVIVTAKATQALSQFNLDYTGKSVSAVWVNGQSAAGTYNGQELQITAPASLAKGQVFTVTVAYVAAPEKLSASSGFFTTKEGSVLATEPSASGFFPSNDYPSDKATYTFHVDVPKGETAVTNGTLVSKKNTKTRTVWTYSQAQPQATAYTQVAVGKYTVINRPAASGVKIRDVVPTADLKLYKKQFLIEGDELTWTAKQVGKFPFPVYGTLVIHAGSGLAGGQTLPVFDASNFWKKGKLQATALWALPTEDVVAQQWFGASVTPKTWSDVWLSRGLYTWYEINYLTAKGYLNKNYNTPKLDTLIQYWYTQQANTWLSLYGPVAQPKTAADLYGPNTDVEGALALYALRQKIGVAKFNTLIRTWVSTFKGKSASTADFIALANKVSGQNLTGFLNSWVNASSVPSGMPGHKTWVPAPADSSAASAASVTSGSSTGRSLGAGSPPLAAQRLK